VENLKLKIDIETCIKTLLFLNAAFWIIIGIITFIRQVYSQLNLFSLSWIMLPLIAGNICALILCGIFINKGSRLIFVLTLGVLAINSVLSITDEVGILDIFTLALNACTLCLLIVFRRKLLKRKSIEEMVDKWM
jgi:hypothetical protein